MRRKIAQVTSTIMVANPIYLVAVACLAAAGGLLIGVGSHMLVDVIKVELTWWIG